MTKLVPASWRDSTEELRERVLSVFDRWRPGRSKQVPAKAEPEWSDGFPFGTTPTIDLAETEDEILVYAEMPGFDRSDFKVELDDRRFVLRGEKKVSRKRKKRNYHYAESSFGSFYRALPLPCKVETGKAKAKYKGGVLKVRLPKAHDAKSRSVRVSIN